MKTKDEYMTIRLPAPIKRKLQRKAELSRRSLSKEVLVTIERGLAIEETSRKDCA